MNGRFYRCQRPFPARRARPCPPIVALSFGACGSGAALRVCDPLPPHFTTQYGVGLGSATQTVTVSPSHTACCSSRTVRSGTVRKYRVVTLATIGSALTALHARFSPRSPRYDCTMLLARRPERSFRFRSHGSGTLFRLNDGTVLARFLIGHMLEWRWGRCIGAWCRLSRAGPVFVALAVCSCGGVAQVATCPFAAGGAQRSSGAPAPRLVKLRRCDLRGIRVRDGFPAAMSPHDLQPGATLTGKRPPPCP